MYIFLPSHDPDDICLEALGKPSTVHFEQYGQSFPICLGGMKSQEEDRVTALGMCRCLPTAVPGLLVCFGLVTSPHP